MWGSCFVGRLCTPWYIEWSRPFLEARNSCTEFVLSSHPSLDVSPPSGYAVPSVSFFWGCHLRVWLSVLSCLSTLSFHLAHYITQWVVSFPICLLSSSVIIVLPPPHLLLFLGHPLWRCLRRHLVILERWAWPFLTLPLSASLIMCLLVHWLFQLYALSWSYSLEASRAIMLSFLSASLVLSSMSSSCGLF